MRVLLDADALLKLTRAGAKELVVSAFSVVVPMEVIVEAVEEGKRAGHSDALVVEENVRRGRIAVASDLDASSTASVLRSPGDRSILEHSLHGGFAAVVTDDGALLRHLKALGVSATVPAGLLLAAGRRKRRPASELRELLEALRPHISSEEYVTYLLTLEGRYPRK